MAYSYDGYLRFNTEVDQSGFDHGISGMQSAAAVGAKAIAAGITVATGAVTALSAYAISAGSNFEAAMSKVAATSQASTADMELLTAKAKEMGATTKFSATESAEALNYMAMAGWKTQQSIEGLPGIMNLAAASGEDLGNVSDIVTDAITAFGLKASDSAHFADVLAAAASSANTDVSMMGSTFKYAAPLAGALGYSIEDTAVATGLMANAGIKAETAGTTLRTMFSNMTGDVQLTGQELGNYTLKMQEVDGTMVPLSQTMGGLREAFSKMTEAEKLSNAESLVGKEAMSGLLAIVNASEADYNKLTAAIGNADGAAADMAKTVNDNLKGDLTILGSTAESVGIKIYEKFENPMRKAAKAATDSLSDVLDSLGNGKLDQSIDKIADSTGDLLAKTAELTANGLPKLINGFAFVVDHGEEAKNTILSIAAAYGVMLAASNVAKWQAMTTAAMAYRTAMIANMGITINSATATGILTTMMSTQEIVVGTLTGKVGLHTAATILAERAQLAFNASILAMPAFWAVAAVAALAAGLVYLVTQESDTEKETKKLNEALEEQRNAREEAEKARQETIDGSLAEINHAEDLIDKLKDITDANGKVKEGYEGRAKALRDQINKIIPDTIKLSEDEGKMYLQVADNLDLLMQKKRLNALIDANQEAYNEAIKNQSQYVDDLRIANENLADAKAEQKRINDELAKAGLEGSYSKEKNDIDALVSSYGTAAKTAEETLGSSAKSIEDFEDLIAASASDNMDVINEALNNQIQNTAIYTNKNKEEMDKQLSDTAGNYESLLKLAVKNGGEIRDTELNLLIEKRKALQTEVDSYLGTGEKIPQNLKDGILNTEQEFVEAVNVLFTAGKITAEQKTTLLGTVGGQWGFALGDGIESEDSKTKITTAAENAVGMVIDATNATLGIENGVSSKGSEAGGYYIAGVAQGLSAAQSIRNLNTSAATAANSVDATFRKMWGINSPAKKAVPLGEFYLQGIEVGFEKEKPKMLEKIAAISDSAIKTAKEKAGSYKEIGTLYIKSMESGIDSQTDSLIEQVEKIVDAQVEAFGEENEDAKDDYEKAANELMDTYKEALETGADEAKRAVSEKIKGITEEAQNQYDEIIRQRDRMQDKLSDFGELFTRDEDGKVQLENINKQTEALKRYQTALEGLQDKGISEGLLSEILDMGVEDGTDFAEKLLKNDGVFRQYNEAWTLKQEAAKTIAEQFYSDELETLDEDFTQKLDTALAGIPTECTNVGVDAIKGVIKGMNDQKSDAVAAAKDIADAIIKELKRATETASPSKRAAREVGKPITQGVIKGMKDAYDPQELQAYTDRMMLDIGSSQAKAAQNVSYLNTSSVSNSSVYNGGDFILKIEKMVNEGKGSISSLLQEAEFYRKQKVSAVGGA